MSYTGVVHDLNVLEPRVAVPRRVELEGRHAGHQRMAPTNGRAAEVGSPQSPHHDRTSVDGGEDDQARDLPGINHGHILTFSTKPRLLRLLTRSSDRMTAWCVRAWAHRVGDPGDRADPPQCLSAAQVESSPTNVGRPGRSSRPAATFASSGSCAPARLSGTSKGSRQDRARVEVLVGGIRSAASRDRSRRARGASCGTEPPRWSVPLRKETRAGALPAAASGSIRAAVRAPPRRRPVARAFGAGTISRTIFRSPTS
jgi:hypothetical protein